MAVNPKKDDVPCFIRSLPNYGVIYTIKEIVEMDVTGTNPLPKSVRVKGKLTEHNRTTCVAVIAHLTNDIKLTVETHLIEPISYSLNSLLQFIGELNWDNISGLPSPTLIARTVRCVDDLDFIAYEKVLSLQRTYLHSRDVTPLSSQEPARVSKSTQTEEFLI